MKKLKLVAFMVLALISFSSVNAQVASAEKGTINTSEKKIHKVNHDGMEYHIIDGIWYTKFKKRLVLRQAPKGAKVKFLPKEGKTVTMGGKKYYKCKGVFYKKIGGGQYEVARP